MRRLKLIIGSVELSAELLETATAEAIYQSLPFTSRAQTWGDEVRVPRRARHSLRNVHLSTMLWLYGDH